MCLHIVNDLQCIYIYIFFFIFFSTVVYPRILNICYVIYAMLPMLYSRTMLFIANVFFVSKSGRKTMLVRLPCSFSSK